MDAHSPKGLVAITAGGPHAWIMINALRKRFGSFPVIVERPEPETIFWKRRRRMLGPVKAMSMQAARIPIKLRKLGADKIIQEMIETHQLEPAPAEDMDIYPVPSVNGNDCRRVLKELKPKAVFVISTRMISRSTLKCVEAPFINYHSGINPAYRGMFGGYFALANGEPENFGATVHLIDEGVDTGDILYQSQVNVDHRDNFHTYLWRIAAGSREIVVRAVEDALQDQLSPRAVDLPSRQYFAPTLGQYVWTGVRKGVW